MTEQRQMQITPAVTAMAALSILIVGAGGMYFLMRDGRTSESEPAPRAAVAPPSEPSAGESGSVTRTDVVVPLTKEVADRAGIEVSQVTMQAVMDHLRLPGVVEPDAYRRVPVTSLVGGRVVSVSAQLGDRVRKGQSIAKVYSPEVAEARAKFLAAEAMLDAHERELKRTQELAEIGAASRQELERVHAEHVAQTADVESARSRLLLLGADADGSSVSNARENATMSITAPIDGLVTERLANVGLNVEPTTKLFTVVDLSNVWVVADAFEQDLQRVREGMRATVTTTTYPDRPLEGRVSFIEPQLSTATRTARIRVEVPNPQGDLRLGMFADVAIESPDSAPVLAVPKAAVQTVGDRQFVYVPQANRTAFVEREVRLGRVMGDHVEVLAGLSAGDSMVSKGSFFVRAEAERLGLRSPQ